ncbi:MAG: transglycosylase domain-containing protein, partial [Clostridia bacterium]|nr:transglycosylase domain-containing protein [Clostridia bacterium]
VKNAFIASEDKNFYRHKGYDIARIIKAFFVNAKSGAYVQGASTISQQLIKNTQLTGEKTIKRKLKEIKLAQKLESIYQKDEILTMYLNNIYFGENCYGIENAAYFYFGKSQSELDLSEASLLAATIRSPSKINPLADLAATREKQSQVLKAMKNCGFITETEETAAKNANTNIVAGKNGNIASPYFCALESELYEIIDRSISETRNYKVFTGYDNDIQSAIAGVDDGLDCDRQSIVLSNDDGFVSAYHSTCGEVSRMPASTIKPIAVYAPAIENGLITQLTILKDEPFTVDGYTPKNFDDRYYGAVTARDALKLSLNVPAVKILNAIGVKRSLAALEKVGFATGSDAALNLALGHVDGGVKLKTIVGAYATFANFGLYKKPRFIRKITDNDGKVLYSAKTSGVRAFSSGTASVVTDMLKECAKSGTAKRLKDLNFDVACKTGTYGNENGNTDAYSVAYTSDKTVATWLGNADGSYMPASYTGGGFATEAVKSILNNVYREKRPRDFLVEGATCFDVDKYALYSYGEVLVADENTPDEYVIKGLFTDENKIFEKSTVFTRPKICGEQVLLKKGKATISFVKPKFYYVRIYKKTDKEKSLVYEGYGDGFDDYPTEGVCQYSVGPYV